MSLPDLMATLRRLFGTFGGFIVGFVGSYIVSAFGITALLPSDPGNVEGPGVILYACFCFAVFIGLIGGVVLARVVWASATPRRQRQCGWLGVVVAAAVALWNMR